MTRRAPLCSAPLGSWSRRLAGLVGLVALCLAGPGAVSASTPVGQTFTPSGGAAACGDDRTWLQYGVPFDGVITSWSFLADGSPPQLKFKVGRATGGSAFTIVGESAVQTPAAGRLNSYPARIPVLAGDLIGFYTATMGDCLRGGGSSPPLFSRLGEGVVGVESQYNASTGELDVAAALEPDCDGDGFGDESQDPDLLACDTAAPSAAITKGPKNKMKKKRATFEFTGSDARAVAGFQCSLDGAAFSPCTSPHTVKVKKGKHTFAVRAIDQAGNAGAPATDTWKVKKKKRKRK